MERAISPIYIVSLLELNHNFHMVTTIKLGKVESPESNIASLLKRVAVNLLTKYTRQLVPPKVKAILP